MSYVWNYDLIQGIFQMKGSFYENRPCPTLFGIVVQDIYFISYINQSTVSNALDSSYWIVNLRACIVTQAHTSHPHVQNWAITQCVRYIVDRFCIEFVIFIFAKRHPSVFNLNNYFYLFIYLFDPLSRVVPSFVVILFSH